jgi:hypothetical protein
MPKETISEHGIVRTTNAKNRFPKTLLADEELKKSRTHGTATKRAYAKQLKHTTTDEKNSVEAVFDSSQLCLINLPLLSSAQIRSVRPLSPSSLTILPTSCE